MDLWAGWDFSKLWKPNKQGKVAWKKKGSVDFGQALISNSLTDKKVPYLKWVGESDYEMQGERGRENCDLVYRQPGPSSKEIEDQYCPSEQLLARRPDPRLHVPLRICHLQLWQSFHLIFTSELINLASFHSFHIFNYLLVARINFRLSLRTRRVLFTANGMCSWSASSSPSSWSSLESLRYVLSRGSPHANLCNLLK